MQKRAKDICNAYNELKEAWNVVCSDVDTYYKKWFYAAVALGDKVSASDPQLPWHCTSQTAKSNILDDTPELYLKRSVTIPFLDELVNHIDQHFPNIQQKVMMSLNIFPSECKDISQLKSADD